MPEIRRADLSLEGLRKLIPLLRMMFPSAPQLSASYLDWWYNRNPEGPGIAHNAYEQGELIAHFGVSAARASIHGVEERGVLMHNAATHPAHRGKGLFKALVERTLEEAHDTGHRFAFAASNANSTFAFVERLGFQLVGPLEVKLGVGPTPRASEPSDPDFRRVWGASSLGWRVSPPHTPYCKRTRREELTLFAAGTMRIPVELGTYSQHLLPGSLPDLGRLHPMRAWIGLHPGRAWPRGRYYDLPVPLRPSPLNFIFRDLTGGGRALDGDRVRVDGLDLDQF